MRRFCHRFALPILLACILLTLTPPVHAAGPVTAPAGGNLHDQLIAQYMQGKWEDVEKELITSLKGISAMPAAQRQDVEYIRHAIAEGRPSWWKLCKAGQRIGFKPLVWRETLAATFDPATENRQQIKYANGAMTVVVGWKSAEMDDTALARESEFTKGEYNELAVWNVLGNSQAWGAMSPHFLLKLPPEGQNQYKLFVAFRGNVAALYYCSPRARRLAICNAITDITGEYSKSQDAMCRKVLAAMYVAEVFSHPKTYPSIQWPQDPPADGAELKTMLEMRDWLKHNDLTFPEDKALREAARTFAMANANEAKFRQAGTLILPSALGLSLDPAADKPLAARRDAWIKARYAKGR